MWVPSLISFKALTLLCRLDLQHYCFKELLGFNISPQIPIPPDDEGLAIADIGTGTGFVAYSVGRFAFRYD